MDSRLSFADLRDVLFNKGSIGGTVIAGFILYKKGLIGGDYGTDIQTYRYTDIQTYRHTDKQTLLNTFTIEYFPFIYSPQSHSYINKSKSINS